MTDAPPVDQPPAQPTNDGHAASYGALAAQCAWLRAAAVCQQRAAAQMGDTAAATSLAVLIAALDRQREHYTRRAR